jgi:1-acyl-sn-glycerol-3-phosphate acyltransferase
MKRIILLVIKLIFFIPGWLLKIRKYNKKDDTASLKEKYQFIIKIVNKVIKVGNINVECYGVENLPSEQGYLMTPNHQGLFDPIIMFYTHSNPFRAVVKQELTNTIVVKDIIKMMGYLPMDRSNLRASMKVIRQVTKELKEGINYVIFPEGTRCKQQNKMLEFKAGSFKAAVDAKVPIVPVALIDCYKVFDDNSIKTVNTQVHYLKPLYYEEYKDLSSVEIAAETQSRIAKCIEEYE